MNATISNRDKGSDECRAPFSVLKSGRARKYRSKGRRGKRGQSRSVQWNADLQPTSPDFAATVPGSVILAGTTTDVSQQRPLPQGLAGDPSGAAIQLGAPIKGATGPAFQGSVATPVGLAAQIAPRSPFVGNVDNVNAGLLGGQGRQAAAGLVSPAQMPAGRAHIGAPSPLNVQALCVPRSEPGNVAIRAPLQPWPAAEAHVPGDVYTTVAPSDPSILDAIEPTSLVILIMALGTVILLIIIMFRFAETRSLQKNADVEDEYEPLTDFNLEPARGYVNARVTARAELSAVRAANGEQHKNQADAGNPQGAT
ncbi:hypothetical protein MTO96_028083 [Rhipicephalus appendiculatus]